MKIGALLLTAISLTIPSYGVLITVRDGEVETTAIGAALIPDPDDGVLIESRGILTTGATDAITLTAAGQTVDNLGQILTTTGIGIFADTTTGVMITNSGLISTTSGIGIRFNDTVGGVILNSGRISTTGGGAHGIELFDVSTDAVIGNSGTIITQGGGAHGINVSDNAERATIINSGKIITTGAGANAFFHGAPNCHIINSGILSSVGSLAINDISGDLTLTLLRGSNIQGGVEVIAPLNVNVETGLNLALTIDSSDFGAFGIQAPYIQVGAILGVIDPTVLTLQPDVIADLSDTILNGIYRHRLGCCTPCGCGAWVEGVGSYRKRDHAHEHVGYDNWQAGFLVGYDKPICNGYLGFFAGTTYGETAVDQHTQKAFINSYVLGATYETCFCNTFVGLALTAGYIDWDNNRYVMNNLAGGGVEIANADIDGLFLSPELTLARQFSCFCWEPNLSFTLRYAGFYPGSYSENGSLTNLSVDDRYINLLTTRFEAGLPYSESCGRCCWSIEPYIGVYGRYQLGGYGIDGELLGESLSFNQGGPRNIAAFLSGIRGIQSFGCFNLFLNLEASFDSHSSSRILGEGGFGWNF